MLIISARQIEAIEEVLLKRIENNALAFFQKRTKNRIGETEAKMFIAHIIAKVSKYNIFEEKDILTFLNLSITHGLDFELEDEYSWVMEILATRSLSGNEKMHRIEKGILR